MTSLLVHYQEQKTTWIRTPRIVKGNEIWNSIKKELRINRHDFRLNLGNKEIYPNEQLWNLENGDVIQIKLRILGGALVSKNRPNKWIRKDAR